MFSGTQGVFVSKAESDAQFGARFQFGLRPGRDLRVGTKLCDGGIGDVCVRENKDSNTRSSGRKSGKHAEVVQRQEVDRSASFLNRGCVFQDNWK